MSTPTLLEAARGGDRAALERLIAEHEAQIWRFSRAMCRDEQDAAEVLQETMLALARGAGEIRGQSPSTWLYAVARSFCAKKRRRSRFAPPPEAVLPVDALADQLPHAGADPEQALAAARLEDALNEAIRSLEPMYREVLVLRDVDGLSAAEVASALGLGEAAVKSRLHRARRQLEEALAPALGLPPESTAGCPDVLRAVSRDLEGQIDPATCARLERHLEGCSRCRARCDALKRTLALCRSAPAPSVPPEVQRSVRVALREFLRAG